MKLRSAMTINGKRHAAGSEVSWKVIYPFFCVHMLMFGASGFFMAYMDDGPPISFLFMHGGIAITVYLIFYLVIFGLDEVKWMFINAGLGVLGIAAQIDWLLAMFDKQVSDYAPIVHVIPFTYFVLYTFLIRQAILDISKSRNDESRKKKIENIYVGVSVLTYLTLAFA